MDSRKKRRATVRSYQSSSDNDNNAKRGNAQLRPLSGQQMRSSHERRPMRNRKRGTRLSRGVLYSARSLLLPSGPISRHIYYVMHLSILRVVFSLHIPRRHGAVSAHQLALSRSVHPPPSAPSRTPAITTMNSRVNSEAQPRRLHRMDLLTQHRVRILRALAVLLM